jgi:hypothetical protein
VGAEERAKECVLHDGDKRVEALSRETSAGRDRAEQTEHANLEVLSPDPDRVGAKAEAKELKVPKHHVLPGQMSGRVRMGNAIVPVCV